MTVFPLDQRWVNGGGVRGWESEGGMVRPITPEGDSASRSGLMNQERRQGTRGVTLD